jgi:hypothetical protein
VRARLSRVRGPGNQIRAQAPAGLTCRTDNCDGTGVSSGPAYWSSRRTVVRSRRPPTSSSTLSVLACTRDNDGWKPLRDSVITNTTDFDSRNRCYQHRPTLGPFWDHTLCTMANDLHVYERLARAHVGHSPPVTSGNALPQFTGGQEVAGSNPVSPTRIRGVQRLF